AVTLTCQVDETRHILALSHVSLCIGHLATRSRDPTSKAFQAFQSARSENDLGAAFSEHYRSGLAYSTARARNDDDLVFSSLHKILFQTLRSVSSGNVGADPCDVNADPCEYSALKPSLT